MNSTIIKCFEQLIYKTNGDYTKTKDSSLKFKLSSYRKTLNTIKKLDFEISDTNQIKDIKGIGKTTIEKINEILETGNLKQLININTTNSSEIMELQKITGIGPVKAEKLFKQNILLSKLLSIDLNNLHEDDIKIIDNLTHHQLLGLKYFKDLEHKIPYNEIQKIEIYLTKLLKSFDPKLHIIICGSYRRMKPESGDIDILLYHDDIVNDKMAKVSNYLKKFINALISEKFITDNLTGVNNPTKYMGFCKLKQYNRRIDIRLIPNNCVGSAMLYFTGSGDFNKSMRTYAIKMGYTINEYGIYKLKSNCEKGLRIKTESETDIFKVLKLDYVEPKDRLPTYEFPKL
jgi:DNA polymerase beta